jgi:hypothetical protein
LVQIARGLLQRRLGLGGRRDLTGSAAIMHTTRLAAVILAAALSIVNALAATGAAPSELPIERFNLRASGFFAQSIDTRIRVDGHLNAGGGEWDFGTTIDLADQLNVETSVNVFRAEAMWNIGARHRLDLAWFDMEETGRTVLSRDIDFGDKDFTVNLPVDSYFRTNILRLAYTYYFVERPRVQFGLSAGLHVMKVASGISSTNIGVSENVGVTAPFPVLGFNFDYAATSKLLLRVHGEYLKLSYDNYDGELIDFYGAVEWRLNHNWSLGCGIEYFDIDVVATSDRLRLAVEHDWVGYQVYTSFRF